LFKLVRQRDALLKERKDWHDLVRLYKKALQDRPLKTSDAERELVKARAALESMQSLKQQRDHLQFQQQILVQRGWGKRADSFNNLHDIYTDLERSGKKLVQSFDTYKQGRSDVLMAMCFRQLLAVDHYDGHLDAPHLEALSHLLKAVGECTEQFESSTQDTIDDRPRKKLRLSDGD
jgi:hypothetical protein